MWIEHDYETFLYPPGFKTIMNTILTEIVLQLVLKIVGALIVGACLMSWLGKSVDGAQIFVFAIGLTALLFHIPRQK